MNLREKAPNVVMDSHRRPTFLVAIPTFGMVSIHFHLAAQRLQMPVNALVESMIIEGMEIGAAREEICKFYMQYDPRPEFLFMLGDDMVPEWDALINLWKEMRDGQWDVLAGLYFLKQEPPTPILWRDDVVGYLEEGKHYKTGEVVQSDIAGMDFTLIRPEILEKIKRPWFHTGPTMTANNKSIWNHTEDAWFCRKVKQAGGKIGVHSGVRVAHMDVQTGMVY